MSSFSSPPRGNTASSVASSGAAPSFVSSARTISGSQHGSSTASSSTSSTSKEGLRDLFAKRMATLVYLKAVMSSRQHHASIVLLSPRDLQAVFDADRMRKRSYRHLVLGLALSPLFDLSTLPEFARAVLAALTDLEALPDSAGASAGGSNTLVSGGSMISGGLGSMEKRGMRNLFTTKLRTQRRGGTFSDLYPPEVSSMSSVPSGVTGSSISAASGASDGGTVIGSSLPFTLDFFQTFFTLCDILTETYAKLSAFLGASSPASSQVPATSAQSAGLQAPGTTNGPPSSASTPIPSAPPFPHPEGGEIEMTTTALQGPLSPQMVDVVVRLDGKIKKILAQVMKELDTLARQVLKDELSSLEAALSNPSHATVSANGANNNEFAAQTGPRSPYTGLPGPPTAFPTEQ